MLVGLGPLIAPPIGGAVAAIAGWRGVLGVLAAISVAMFVLAVAVVPESLPPEKRHAGGVAGAFARYGTLLRDGGVRGYVTVFAFGFAAMMAYISASPFVGQTVLRMPPLVYAFGFAAGAAGIVLSNLVNARVAPRVGVRRMLLVGVALSVVASVALAVLALTGALQPATFILCAFVLTSATGLIMSNASALALARAAAARGAGAALLGSSQFLVGAIASPLVGLWGEDTAVPMALVALVASAVAAVVVLLTRPRPLPAA